MKSVVFWEFEIPMIEIEATENILEIGPYKILKCSSSENKAKGKDGFEKYWFGCNWQNLEVK